MFCAACCLSFTLCGGPSQKMRLEMGASLNESQLKLAKIRVDHEGCVWEAGVSTED